MKYSLRKISILATQVLLSCSFLLLAACGTQKKAAATSTETSTTQNNNNSTPVNDLKVNNNVHNVQPLEKKFDRTR